MGQSCSRLSDDEEARQQWWKRARVRVCFAVKLGALIPYYEINFHIIESRGIYVYLKKDKIVKT